ncbi:MAG: diphosphate--fructose-6-phosphate 1-phosphotransferase [Chlamydiota bacterium]
MHLEQYRATFAPELPQALSQLERAVFVPRKRGSTDKEIARLFPRTQEQDSLDVVVQALQGTSFSRTIQKVGVVFSGGQAPGGHNVIAGLYDALQKIAPTSVLLGFLGGPSGILEKRYLEIEKELLQKYRNQGGFDLIGSGRTKLESAADLAASLEVCSTLDLDGLVIIGGDDSNTNAALLAEYFLEHGCKTSVVGVPKTIDGDLQSEEIPISFGFDTATKIYAELIGNIGKDALSAKKYYHFIRLMGRSASHVALECALKTHPNLTLLSEECWEKKRSLSEVVEEITTLIEKRGEKGLFYGVLLIPEGLLEFLPEMQSLIQAINEILAGKGTVPASLPRPLAYLFDSLPEKIQQQLLLDRDPHGNVQVSKIETEALLITLVQRRLEEKGLFEGTFRPVSHFLGYEGRAGYPSNFDANYCYSLGTIAALLIRGSHSGYMATCRSLHLDTQKWEPKAIPITMLMQMERRKGKDKPVIRKALVDFSSAGYQSFAAKREAWKWEDDYQMPGPLQLFGPSDLVNIKPISLRQS